MRLSLTSAKSMMIAVGILVLAGQAFAQSSQYQRATNKTAAAAPAPAQAQAQAGRTPAQDLGKDGDRVDISDIEKKYWAPKDTDFSVVQNRLYSKAGRYSVTLGYGMSVNDSYNNGDNYEAMVNYYFSERYGVQLTYINTVSVDNKLTTAFRQQNGVLPDYNKITGFYGASFNWVPFYAKMSFLNSRIMYFDLSVSPGIGNTSYDNMLAAGNKTDNALTYTLDVTQQLFLSRTLALRFDYQNHWFNEDRLKYQSRGNVDGGTVVSQDFNHTIILLFGVTMFF